MYQVLLADDREIFIMEMERLGIWGESSGFFVTGRAGNGAEALSLLREQHFDLVITDICMPKMDGIQLLQEIKRTGLAPCVVLCSEYEDFEYARRGLVLGAFDYLTKPPDRERFLELLRRARTFLRRAEQQEKKSDGISYPAAEEKNILSIISSGASCERIPALFESCAQNLIHLFGEDGSQVSGMLHHLFVSVRTAIFSRYPWLKLYLHDGLAEVNFPDYTAELRALCDLVGRLIRLGIPENMRIICTFILENPEAEITLSAVSERFYINHTYLSNIFHQKTGWRFNDYVTLVRMERARYLLLHSDLKIYEISEFLSYRDTDYFNRLFKKYCGKTPSQFQKVRLRDPQARFASQRANVRLRN